MIDLAAFRADPEAFRRAWTARGLAIDVEALLAEDARVRALKHRAETLKAELNAASRAIGAAARAGGAALEEAKARARALGDQQKAADDERAAAERALHERLLYLPNPCLPEVPLGKDSADNRVVGVWGEPPRFAFAPRPHWELGPQLGIMDFERAAKLAGSGFATLRGLGARLSRALINWFIDTHVANGYTEWSVPHLVLPAIMQGTGQLPKFADQLYRCRDDELLLIPTAEVPLTNLHADEILDPALLPLRYCAYTPCYRREAGAAGVGTRGLTRVHQFDKVEMVWFTTPERARADLDTMIGHATWFLSELGLHHRVVQLCTGDTGFSAACTFDLEVWSPGTQSWLEVSSCSTFTDFQARRANIRYRGPDGKPRFVHTLNGSGLALPRCLIALVETYQQGDGSVLIPPVLRPYLGGCERIAPARQG
ncbi:MAG: serine--tRNA ligase [Planctomycetota bacterium]|nr:serine--tRNA ligase [Planctomycetota bacterium]MCX8040606.1 serine--tRNA ligase [Planctomycetota bacterium]